MSLIENTANNSSAYVWPFVYEHLADPRTQDWLLVSSFKPVLTWIFLYLMMAFYLPNFVKR